MTTNAAKQPTSFSSDQSKPKWLRFSLLTLGPSRKFRCGPNNVVAKYPSRKMNRMVPAESHTFELAFIHQLEHDGDVVEYHAQPSPPDKNKAKPVAGAK